MTLPKALVVGPMKAGTSWIHDYLERRGDVCLPHKVKETFFFDKYHTRGLDWYRARFRHFDPKVHVSVVEVAPTLFPHSDLLPVVIKRDLGDIPIVVTARAPIDRAWSHYQHLLRGDTQKPLQDAIGEFPEIIDASRYELHLPKWKRVFTRVTVVNLSELSRDPESYARTVSEALGLPHKPAISLALGRSNAATQPSFFQLARFGKLVSRGLRRMGFYGVVDLAKRAGLKRLFFGSRAVAVLPSDEEKAYLRRQFPGSNDPQRPKDAIVRD